MMNSTNTLLRLAKIGPLFTRNLAYVSNKRITRIPSDLDVKKDEIDNTGNNVYIDVNLKNRNPRNLEQMLLLPKPMGFELDTPNPHYWNKVAFEKSKKFLTGKIVHFSGRVVVSVSSNEPLLEKYLNNYTTTKAAKFIAQILAYRTLECGIHSVFADTVTDPTNVKLIAFLETFQSNGIVLTEQPFIFEAEQLDW